jgi:PiT family inorganic phosphate transporter
LNTAEAALLVGFALSFLMAIALGGNDAASPTANVVGARVLSVRQSVVLFTVFATVGALSQGYMNMKTVGTGLVPGIDLLGAIVIVLTAFTWIMICNFRGLEISVTHTVVGSILGYGIAAYSISGVKWSMVQTVVLSWFTSPVLAALVAFAIHKFLVNMSGRYESWERSMSTVLKLALCYSAYAFGANDIANATGVYVTVTQMVMGSLPEGRIMFILAIFGSVGVVIGGFWLGPKVIETVAFNIIRLNVASATAAEITNALVVHMFVTIPYIVIGYGVPISTSLANIGALVGVGFSSYGATGINKKTVGILVMSWVMSVGATALVTFTLYRLLLPITGPLLSPMAG